MTITLQDIELIEAYWWLYDETYKESNHAK
jgi:hypothetical protein